MAKAKPDTICLKGMPMIKEGVATAALNPGYLVEFDGATDKVKKQSTAQEDCRRAFALENDLVGDERTDAYAKDDRVRYGSFHAGQEVYARVAAAAPAIVLGNKLEAAGDGTVRKLTANGAVVGFALEAVDNSAGAAEVFIQVEVA